MFLDPSLGLLWLCAFCCIWYGSIRSLQFLREEKDVTVQKATFVQSKKVLLLPILGSIVLVVLFFALDFSITVYILYGLISIVVLASQFFVFAPLFDWVADKISKEPKGFTLPKLGFIPWSGLCLFLFCSAVVTLWLTTANTAGGWIIVDAIAICLGITQMSVLRLPSMKIATLLLLPFLIYDVFWVFISPYFFHGDSVMVSVATRLPPLPLMLKMPRFSDFQYYSILGLGDIVLPGLFIVYLYSFDDYLARPATFKLSDLKNSYLDYFTLSLIEYTFGYIATLTSGYLMNSGQPALLYLVPFTLGPSALIAWHRGDLGLMWKGHYSVASEEKTKKDAEMQGLLNGTEDERQDEREEEANNAPLDSIVVTGSDSSKTGLL